MRLGIQQKSIAAISLLMVALALSLMAMSWYHGSRAIRAELLKRGDIATKNLAYNATYATLIGDTTALIDLLSGVIAEKEVLFARIVESDGTTLVQRLQPQGTVPASGAPAAKSVPTAIIDTAGTAVVRFQIPIVIRQEKASDLATDLHIYDGSGTADSDAPSRVVGYAQIGMTTRYIEESISGLRARMLWVTAIAALIAVFGISIGVRLSIRPINELVVATGRVAAGDYDCKVAEGRHDEIGNLATSFNKMTADLKASRDALVEKDLLEALVVELKDTQQQLVQAGKMAAVGQLAAGVAHEINNPLAGIMGYAQLAAEHMRAKQATGIPPSELPKFIAYIDNMEAQSQRCKQIVQNLLRFARSSAQEENGPININDVMRDTLAFLSYQISARAVKVQTALSDQALTLAGHAGKLQQVFTNIIINAVQAIKHSHGEIHITTAGSDGKIEVRVADNGEGIPAAYLDKIFEPFFTTKEIGQGTGLGLSVTYGLVKDMGGTISVESTVGVGSTFTLTFAAADDAEPNARATTPAAQSVGSHTHA